MSSHHALTCPSGGYPTQRHNELRDLLADALGSVVCDVAIEPPLMPLQGEAVSGNSADGARGFWTRQQNAFFDVRVTHPRPSLLSGPEVAGQLSQHERQKKRQYADRINQVTGSRVIYPSGFRNEWSECAGVQQIPEGVGGPYTWYSG
eukprot:scpid95404/ scgid34934/ 